MESFQQLRVLTVTDVHQSVARIAQLSGAIAEHHPDVVAFVGDFLNISCPITGQFTAAQTARALANLAVEHILFVRGNHEALAWHEFVTAWPFAKRPLLALQGDVFQLGPLLIIGFPCHISYEQTWLDSLPESGIHVKRDFASPARRGLQPGDHNWLEQIFERYGPAARTLWLMHEPPLQKFIGDFNTVNPDWARAIDVFLPLLTISGHDHRTPGRSRRRHVHWNRTICVNAGQSDSTLHYCLLDFYFTPQTQPALPAKILVRIFPWQKQLEITP